MKHLLFSFILLIFIGCKENSSANNKSEADFAIQKEEVASEEHVLVFTKTAGFRHKSIEAGVALIKKLGKENHFYVDHTEDSLQFSTENLKKYDMVMFLSTTLDVLGDAEQDAFKKYIQQGGSFMGIHAASDTEYTWPWYGKLVGAYFENHPSGTPEATIKVLDRSHISTKMLPESWVRKDEWYNFKNINPAIHVLMNLEESSYKGGTNGENHPIAWYHEFDGGRSFYTGGGHSIESFSEPLFVEHVLGGIFYCLNRKS
ncbi:MAG: ThuA domain-containing protein [Galbibacter orientalis]|uniref:ThuA domain-containing protein n=1 Tax=Galbibacter orientalis TaxID=453852 RepID=UPI003001368A